MPLVVAALGRGYLAGVPDARGAATWTEDRDAALEWEARPALERELRRWRRLKEFPAHAGILPGPNVA